MASTSSGRGRHLDDFLAGVDDTFGRLCGDEDERVDFLQAAREFYLDYSGYPQGSIARLPFWRYLLHYAAVGLDETAERPDDREVEHDEQQLASHLSSSMPFLASIVTRSYRFVNAPKPASSSRPRLAKSKSTNEIGVQTEAVQETVPEPEKVPSPQYTP